MLTRALFSVVVIGCLVLEISRSSAEEENTAGWFSPVLDVRAALIMLCDQEVHKELSTTPEQQTKLDDLNKQHQQRLREEQIARRNEPRPVSDEDKLAFGKKLQAAVDARNREFRPQIWTLLTDAQRERVRQLVLQFNVAQTLSEDPELKETLKITSEQNTTVKRINKDHHKRLGEFMQKRSTIDDLLKHEESSAEERDAEALKILTDEQRTEWEKLIGKPIDVSTIRPRITPLKPQRPNRRTARES